MFRKRRRLNKRNSKPTIIASQSVSRKSGKRGAMVRGSRVVEIISKTLSEMLVCPLSEQPLRVCEKSNSLISHAIGVSFPIVDGIPCLVPRDGEIVETDSDRTAADAKTDHKTAQE
ncbi:hypothetical protein HanRHA438_Chr15g0712901 [Helianthus annuus]|uniref:Protein preY, mitochondrial n=2 Tax=Helianthus annuus TaxID=4232 RepID=A0A9K3E155_HELAN|nr:hypothetical protein HanXRQr2_Chr15g0700691 [Helianthus annuus]KAJ0451742.1 hypothetical protein HanHA300_Chr15g0571031 [Helianthus annuus]KAJ0473628.1 hypothetical protein HanHA89_Chr15g0620501 [Helianthus annuus]KAJ0649205.1 hypothetical protein HanLR1_Chr15g0581601 [Helianthus annuus]KAJ0653006.1 hypothetical protein HanOQP8_Chr15g0578631 [Helianthus annuus]